MLWDTQFHGKLLQMKLLKMEFRLCGQSYPSLLFLLMLFEYFFFIILLLFLFYFEVILNMLHPELNLLYYCQRIFNCIYVTFSPLNHHALYS